MGVVIVIVVSIITTTISCSRKFWLAGRHPPYRFPSSLLGAMLTV